MAPLPAALALAISIALAFVVSLVALATLPLTAQAAPRLLVVSLDGLYPEAYLDPGARDLEIPNILSLVERGVSVEAMTGVFPSTTYPTHATLITGVRPWRHGVTANAFFNPANGSRDMHWFASGLRVPNLLEVAHAAELVVASVQWPCLADAAYVDFRIPEIWSVDDATTTRELHERFATRGLIERIEKKFGPWKDENFEWGAQDERITDAAVALIELERPDATFVHIIEIDHVLHEWGRDSKQGLAAIEVADRQLGRMLAALEGQGALEKTDVVILSDHGFASVHSVMRPNVVLADLGLLTAPSRGNQLEEWRGLFHMSAAAGAFYLNDDTDAAARDMAMRRFEELAEGRYRGLFEVLDRERLDDLGAFPGAEFGVVAAAGFDLSSDLRGPFMSATHHRGQHGYLPEMREMNAAFIAAGPSFREGLRIPSLRMIDVAPTLAEILGVDLGDQVEGIVVPGILTGDHDVMMD